MTSQNIDFVHVQETTLSLEDIISKVFIYIYLISFIIFFIFYIYIIFIFVLHFLVLFIFVLIRFVS